MRKSTLSNFDHLLKYKSPLKAKTFRSTQIICTIDVECDEVKLQKMIAAGMNIACFDCAQAPVEAFERTIKNLRSALKNYNESRKSGDNVDKCFDVSVATAFDVKAETLTTGNPLNYENYFLKMGNTVNITNNKDYIDSCDKNWIYINYPHLTELKKQQIIYIGEKIKLAVEDVDRNEAVACCRIIKGGFSNNEPMDVLIPGVKLTFPPINKEFLDILEFAKKNHVDMIFAAISDHLAFETVKCLLKNQEYSMALVAKIENQAGYDNIDKFIEHADGILISRYQMALNCSIEKAMAAQKCIIAKCLKAGVPSIVSSKMLSTMNENEPSSAEISDIFNATIDGCDCIVLETDSIRCIEKMQDTILESEQMINYRRWFRDLLLHVPVPSDTSNSIALSACMSSMVSNASAIIVLTAVCGKIARLIAKYRPECPIVVVTSSEFTARQCLLLRGVSSICIKDQTESYLRRVENAIDNGLQFIRQSYIIQKYPSTVVAVYSHKEGLISTNVMRIINVENNRKSLELSDVEIL